MLEAVNTVLKKFGKSSFIGFHQGPSNETSDQGEGQARALTTLTNPALSDFGPDN